MGEGTVGAFAVATNFCSRILEPRLSEKGIEKPQSIRLQAQEHVRNFDIRTPDFQTPVGTLSGETFRKFCWHMS
ncbi:hypothetical protein HED51_15825 [Ochrobactrum grignonense]|nr:hypothetical protein [Brucella grignonensis]